VHSNLLTLICLRIAGTTGAVLTCPLEVIKTRLQAHTETIQLNKCMVHSNNPNFFTNSYINAHTTANSSQSSQSNAYYFKKRHSNMNRFQMLRAKFSNISYPTVYVQLQYV
jgi:hypothetical protein